MMQPWWQLRYSQYAALLVTAALGLAGCGASSRSVTNAHVVGTGRGITPARFADSSKLSVGEIVLAEGSPLGLQSSVTDGIISALGRDVSEGHASDLGTALAALRPGEKITLSIVRPNRTTATTTVTLGQLPGS